MEKPTETHPFTVSDPTFSSPRDVGTGSWGLRPRQSNHDDISGESHCDHRGHGRRKVHRGGTARAAASPIGTHPRVTSFGHGGQRPGGHDAEPNPVPPRNCICATSWHGQTADRYAEEGFDAIVQDVIIGSELASSSSGSARRSDIWSCCRRASRCSSGGRNSARRPDTCTSPPVLWTRCCGGRPRRSATGLTPAPDSGRDRRRRPRQPGQSRRLSATLPRPEPVEGQDLGPSTGSGHDGTLRTRMNKAQDT